MSQIVRDREVPNGGSEPQAIAWCRYMANYPAPGTGSFIHDVLTTQWHSVFDFNGSETQKLGELNPLRRSLSERALCGGSYALKSISGRIATEQNLPPGFPNWPEGFEHVRGTITARNPQAGNVLTYTVPQTGDVLKQEDVYHEYFRRVEEDGSETVWCFTGAQVVNPFGEIDDPGRRMQTLEVLALAAGKPELFTRIDDNIGVIYGEVGEIERVLGLTYEHESTRRARLQEKK